MRRRANLYVRQPVSAASQIKTLLENNGISPIEIDLTDDGALREQVFANANLRELPIVELDGRFVPGSDLLVVARAFKLRLICGPANLGACC